MTPEKSRKTHPFCSRCSVSSLCLGDTDGAIRSTNAYLCPHCRRVFVGSRGIPETAICGQFYATLSESGRITECTDPGCCNNMLKEQDRDSKALITTLGTEDAPDIDFSDEESPDEGTGSQHP